MVKSLRNERMFGTLGKKEVIENNNLQSKGSQEGLRSEASQEGRRRRLGFGWLQERP
jgi:hypothetical protein